MTSLASVDIVSARKIGIYPNSKNDGQQHVQVNFSMANHSPF